MDAIRGLREVSPRSRVLMLTVSEDSQDLAAALRNGAQGICSKPLTAICWRRPFAVPRRGACGQPGTHGQAGGGLPVAKGRLRRPARRLRRRWPRLLAAPRLTVAPLSPREEEVLREIARGMSNKEIARVLDIAETTVKIHVQHILRKLGLTSRVQAAVYASDRQRAE